MPSSAVVSAIVDAGVVRAGADDQRRAPRRAHARARVDDRLLLVGVERGCLAGGAQGDDAGHAVGEILAAEPLDRLDVDRARRVERRDQRDPDSVEIEVTRHAESVTVTGRLVPSADSRRVPSAVLPLVPPDRAHRRGRRRVAACCRACSASAARCITTPAIRVLGATPLEAIGSTLPSILPSSISGSLRYNREDSSGAGSC